MEYYTVNNDDDNDDGYDALTAAIVATFILNI